MSNAHEDALEEIRGLPLGAFVPRPAPRAASARQRRAIRSALSRSVPGCFLRAPSAPHADPSVAEGMCAWRSIVFGAIIAEAAEYLTAAGDWRTFPITLHADTCPTVRTDDATTCACRPLLTWGGARC